MDYTQAINTTVSKATAKREIDRHGCDWEEFLAEVGDKTEYTGAEVLNWLGY